MIVLSGASASGKTEVAKLLAKKYGITKIITTTTRSMRINEVDGRDYFFVSLDKFKEMIDEDKFVEFTSYNNHFYGSTKDQIQENRCVVIDPSGLKSYSALGNPSIITFFLECGEDERYKRMLLRGDKKEDAESRIINDRITFAKDKRIEVDYLIDSEHHNIEEVTDMVYKLYQEILHKRQLLK